MERKKGKKRKGKSKNVPSLNLLSDPQPGRQILREDGRAKPIFGIVGNLNGLFLALHHDQRDGRAEGFRLVDVHGLGHAVDQDRPHARLGALLRVQIARQDRGALGERLLDQFFVLLHGRRRHEDGRRRRLAVHLVHGVLEGGAEGFGDGGMDEDALGRHADLPAVHKGARGAGRRGGGEVGVLEHDGGRFPAEFHEDGLEVLAGVGGDDAADGGAAGVVDLLDEGVLDDGAGHGGGVGGAAVDDVDDAVGEARRLQDGADDPEGAGGQLGAFEDAGVAGGDGVGYGAEAEDERRVPFVGLGF